MRHADEVAGLPLLLWGFSVTMTPLGYMAKNEGPDSFGTSLGVMLSLVAYAVLTIIYLFDGTIDAMWIGVGIAVTAATLLATMLAFAKEKQSNLKISRELPEHAVSD